MNSTPDPLGMTARGEARLGGGGMNVVVRVEDTVHREPGPWTPAVHALLRHLEQVGFEGSPRVLGFDGQGREILSYVAGESARAPFSPVFQEHATLTHVAHLVRDYHAAVRDFKPPANAAWQFCEDAPLTGIVCHNDLSPDNTVFREGIPVAFIDWDFAAPAPPAWDLAFAADRYVPLYPEQDRRKLGFVEWPAGPRLRCFVDAYGLDDRNNFVELIAKRVWSLYATMRALSATRADLAVFWQRTHGEHWLRAIDHINDMRDEWQRHIAN